MLGLSRTMVPRARLAGWAPALLATLVGLALLLALPGKLPPLLERIGFPYQIDPSEGVILGETRLLLEGVDIYAPARPDFFTAAPYPPLYYRLLGPLLAAGLPPFPAARVVVALAAGLLALIAGGLVAARTRRLEAGLVTAGLWLAPNLVAVWAARARPDLPALVCNLLGLAAVWAACPPDDRPPPAARRRATLLALAVLLFIAGFYFKHTALAAPAAAGLYLLLRAPRAAVLFGIGYAAGVLGSFGLLTLATGGGFYQKLIAFHRSWSWTAYQELALPFAARYWPLLALPLTGAALEAARRRRPDLPTLYLAAATLVGLGAGTHGGNHNHLLEMLLAAALAAGYTLARALPTRLAAPALLLAALSTGLLLTEPATGRAWLAPDLRPPAESVRLGWEQVLLVVAGDPGPVYSDNVGLLLLGGQPIRYTDPFTLAAAAQAGLWSDRALVEQVRSRQFSLIALRYDVGRLQRTPTDITPDLLAAIREHYVVADRNVMFLYRPR